MAVGFRHPHRAAEKLTSRCTQQVRLWTRVSGGPRCHQAVPQSSPRVVEKGRWIRAASRRSFWRAGGGTNEAFTISAELPTSYAAHVCVSDPYPSSHVIVVGFESEDRIVVLDAETVDGAWMVRASR